MNILLINHYAGSKNHGMEYRPYYFGREWVHLGHSVTIVSASFSHVRNKMPKMRTSYLSENLDGIRYFWLKTPPYHGNGVNRVINIFAFLTQLLRYKKVICNRFNPQVVIASSTYPMDIFLAKNIANQYQSRLVFEVHDLWPLSLIELGGMSPKHPFIMLNQFAENYAYRNADTVISMFPNAREYMISHGMAENKFIYIPNGVDPQEWQEADKGLSLTHKEMIDDLRKKSQFLLGYAGAHGLANSLVTLLEAAKWLKGLPVSIVLVGQGPEKAMLKKKAAEDGLENVHFLNPVPKEEIHGLLSMFDAAYIGLQPQPLFRFGVSPNKLMDYMMASKPVIYAIKAGNDMVKESNCGFSVPPENPRAISEAIIQMMNLPPADRQTMGNNGRAYVH